MIYNGLGEHKSRSCLAFSIASRSATGSFLDIRAIFLCNSRMKLKKRAGRMARPIYGISIKGEIHHLIILLLGIQHRSAPYAPWYQEHHRGNRNKLRPIW